jgi:hypothetical protein
MKNSNGWSGGGQPDYDPLPPILQRHREFALHSNQIGGVFLNPRGLSAPAGTG